MTQFDRNTREVRNCVDEICAQPMQGGFLGFRSGIGLVAANMIGAGVFLSTGYLAQDMGPGLILISWVFGAFLAMSGALAYAEIAREIGRSGGEYSYLSDMWHPMVGSMAGWGSLLLGFAAPIAVDAYAVGAFLNTVVEGPDPRITGTLLIVALTLAHALHKTWSKQTQNGLVMIKVVFLVGFIVVGLLLGNWDWPAWTPPGLEEGESPSVGSFLTGQYWIAFAFSGWNAAIYIAGEFRNPTRDVPRALLFGGGLVGIIYLLVNWVFVANLTPGELAVVTEYEATRITLGHVIVEQMVHPLGAIAMSLFAILAFTSAMSAMTLVGPRVYAEMSRDGYLPKIFGSKEGRIPMGAVMLQGVLSLVLLWTHSVLQAVESAAGILLLFSLLTVLGLMVAWYRGVRSVRRSGLIGGAIYILGAAAILGYGLQTTPHLWLWLMVLVVLGWVTNKIRAKQVALSARSVVSASNTR